MSNKNKAAYRRTTTSAKSARREPIAADGRERWHIVFVDGRYRTIATSVTSSQVMNEAMDVYSDALKRLANR